MPTIRFLVKYFSRFQIYIFLVSAFQCFRQTGVRLLVLPTGNSYILNLRFCPIFIINQHYTFDAFWTDFGLFCVVSLLISEDNKRFYLVPDYQMFDISNFTFDQIQDQRRSFFKSQHLQRDFSRKSGISIRFQIQTNFQNIIMYCFYVFWNLSGFWIVSCLMLELFEWHLKHKFTWILFCIFSTIVLSLDC